MKIKQSGISQETRNGEGALFRLKTFTASTSSCSMLVLCDSSAHHNLYYFGGMIGLKEGWELSMKAGIFIPNP